MLSRVSLNCVFPPHCWSSQRRFLNEFCSITVLIVANFDFSLQVLPVVVSIFCYFLKYSFRYIMLLLTLCFFHFLHSRRVVLCFIGPKIFRNIFHSDIRILFSSDFLRLYIIYNNMLVQHIILLDKKITIYWFIIQCRCKRFMVSYTYFLYLYRTLLQYVHNNILCL